MRYKPETNALAKELGDIVKHRPPQHHLVLYETEPSRGYGEVLFLDANGVHVSHEAMGTWVAYAKEVPKPKVTDLSQDALKQRLELYDNDARAAIRRAIDGYRR
jgi:hypothetical protein